MELTPEEKSEVLYFFKNFAIPTTSKEELLELFTLEDRLEGLTPEEIFAQLSPKDRLGGLTTEEIEAYLYEIEDKETESRDAETMKLTPDDEIP